MRVWIAVYMQGTNSVTLKGTAKIPIIMRSDFMGTDWRQSVNANLKPTFNAPDVVNKV